jgi:hypothetical protein
MCPALKELGLAVEEIIKEKNKLNTKLEQLQNQIKLLASKQDIQQINTNIERLQTNSEHKQPEQRELGAWSIPMSPTRHQQPLTKPQANPKTPDPTLEIVINNVPYTKEENTTTIVEAIIKARNITIDSGFTCFRALNKTKTKEFEQGNPPKLSSNSTTIKTKTPYSKTK